MKFKLGLAIESNNYLLLLFNTIIKYNVEKKNDLNDQILMKQTEL